MEFAADATAMRILYLAPVHPLLTRGHPLPVWQTQMSHIRALEQLGHHVHVVRYTPLNHICVTSVERLWFNTKILLQASLRKFANFARCSTYFPIDVIFLSFGADVLLPQTVRLLKYIVRAPLVILSGVSPLHDGNPREWAMATCADLIATNDPKHAEEWRGLGAKRTIVLPLSAIDPELYKGLPLQDHTSRDIDVLFVGTVTPEREIFFRKLRKLLPPDMSFVIKNHVFEEGYRRLLCRAKIALNPLRAQMPSGANLRLFEIPACETLQLARYTDPSWFVAGKEIVTYKNVENAAQLVKYYLSHRKKRETISRRGQERVFREHTFTHRFKKLIEITEHYHKFRTIRQLIEGPVARCSPNQYARRSRILSGSPLASPRFVKCETYDYKEIS